MSLVETLLFFKKFIVSPKRVGSIAPSSRFLAREMMRSIDWKNVRFVAELGAGTGVFTREIQARRHSECRAIIFEQDAVMRRRLRQAFPSFSLYPDACKLSEAMSEQSLPGLDCVFSGLPFANFSEETRDGILDQAWAALKPDGLFIMFQYSLQLKRRLQRQFIRVDTSFVPLNIPPAFVHVCRKHTSRLPITLAPSRREEPKQIQGFQGPHILQHELEEWKKAA